MAASVTQKPIGKTPTAGRAPLHQVQNYTFVWLDSNIDETQQDMKHSLSQIRSIVTTIDTFTDVGQCLDFLDQLEQVKIFMIISGALGQSTLPHIHDRPELDSIYVFCGNKARHEEWVKQWPKVKGVFTKIDKLCGVLKQDTEECDRSSISISVTTNDLDHLDPSFMYTQLLKEILIKMDYTQQQKKDLLQLCRGLYEKDEKQMGIIDEFERDYDKRTPIWWYTRECFTYQLLNRALRTQDVRVLIKIGFFLRDVHQNIKQLHSESQHSDDVFVVYRGQGMSNADFKRIKQCRDALLAFNNFLSTSFDKNVSLAFARRTLNNPQSIGILFKMTIDPRISSAPFAKLDHVSYFKESEKELLFSMHTVFRIEGVEMIGDRLWQVNLTLDNDAADRELRHLTKSIREEVTGSKEWHQLASVLLRTGNYDDAEDIYHVLREQAESDCSEQEIAYLYQQLAYIKNVKGEYQQAIEFHQKCLNICLKSLPPTHPDLTTNYSNIASVHDNMGEYSKALEFHQKDLDICLKSLPPNHPHLARSYSHMGSVYNSMGEYSKALESHHKSLEIYLKCLRPNHPELAAAYRNIGIVYKNLGEFNQAFDFYGKALQIFKDSLPLNHPRFVLLYNKIGELHESMGEHGKALEYYENALQIQKKGVSSSHPDLATTIHNMGSIKRNSGEYQKALDLFSQALEMRNRTLPANHPDIACSYHSIALVHEQMGEHSKT